MMVSVEQVISVCRVLVRRAIVAQHRIVPVVRFVRVTFVLYVPMIPIVVLATFVSVVVAK